jgi:hypothetical protein
MTEKPDHQKPDDWTVVIDSVSEEDLMSENDSVSEDASIVEIVTVSGALQ